MPELSTPEGKKLDADPVKVDREFARAMVAETDAEIAAPPDRKPPAEGERPVRRRPPKNQRTTGAPPKNATPAKPNPELDKQRSDGIKGIVQISAAVCMGLDSRTPDSNCAFKADAIVLASNADPIADAVVETAKHNAQFAAVVDRITAAGPYAALVGVAMSVGMQLARNHGFKAAEAFGAQAPEAIVAAVEEADADQVAMAAEDAKAA